MIPHIVKIEAYSAALNQRSVFEIRIVITYFEISISYCMIVIVSSACFSV